VCRPSAAVGQIEGLWGNDDEVAKNAMSVAPRQPRVAIVQRAFTTNPRRIKMLFSVWGWCAAARGFEGFSGAYTHMRARAGGSRVRSRQTLATLAASLQHFDRLEEYPREGLKTNPRKPSQPSQEAFRAGLIALRFLRLPSPLGNSARTGQKGRAHEDRRSSVSDLAHAEPGPVRVSGRGAGFCVRHDASAKRGGRGNQDFGHLV
jgi:hypothetical protein